MRVWLAIVFVVAAAIAAAAFAPLGAALAWGGADRLGVSAASAEGTVWRGRLNDARYGPLRLGEVEVRLDPVALLTGRLRLVSRAGAGAFQGRAVWMAAGKVAGLEAIDGDLSATVLRTGAPIPSPIRLRGASVLFSDGRCLRASGQVSATGEAGGLAGAIACREGALYVPLRGRSVLGDTGAAITVQGDGRYRVETRVTAPDPAMAASLRLAGFADTGGVMLRNDEGRLALR